MQEIWKDVEGYEGFYQVSNFGNVKSLDVFVLKKNFKNEPVYVLRKGRILKQGVRCGGYLGVGLSKYGKTTSFSVHRIVAKAFIDNPNNLPQINHKDEDKTNNRVDNLEWCDSKYNNNYGTHNERAFKNRVITHNKPVYCIELNKVFNSAEEAGRTFGINRNGIAAVCKGRKRSAAGYHWKYANEVNV
jgi:hypothetical protein